MSSIKQPVIRPVNYLGKSHFKRTLKKNFINIEHRRGKRKTYNLENLVRILKNRKKGKTKRETKKEDKGSFREVKIES